MFSPFLTCISSSEKWKELNELIVVLWWLLSLGQGPDTAGDQLGAETTVGVPAAGWGWGGPSPVLDGSPGVPAAAYADHEQGEEEEKGRRCKAHAVDGAVAEQGATVDVALKDDGRRCGPLLTHPRQLWGDRAA